MVNYTEAVVEESFDGLGVAEKANPALQKSYSFALRIVKLYKFLCEEKKEFVLSKQVLRSGTSIGANTEEAIGGYSERDFAAKIGISYKEARETRYWLRLLADSGYISQEQRHSLLSDCDELLRILGSIQMKCRTKRI